MNKAELIARLQDLSKKLGRDLSIEGTNDVLEARVVEAEAELALLDDNGDDNVEDTAETNGDVNTIADAPLPKVDEESNVTRRRLKLYRTLDVWHYKKGADRRNPNKAVRVRGIVPAGEEIEVDADDAADIIREEHGRAL